MSLVDPQRYYARYGVTNPAYMVSRRAGRRIREHGKTYLKGRMLDIGCGAKWKFDLVGDCVEEYVGLDHEDTMHDRSVVDIWGTAYDIPEPDEAFDSILCTTVLEHLEEPQRALVESARVLKAGGHALYTMPLFWHTHEEPRDFFRYTEYGLEHLFQNAGFTVNVIEPLSGFWLTFATEANYYISHVTPRVGQPLAKLAIALNNMVAPVLDAADMRLNPRWKKWSWLHLVVARKGS